ncbi:MAG: hypothetical protein ACTSQ8_09925 [Candidatus Helarchaeota archaeon]
MKDHLEFLLNNLILQIGKSNIKSIILTGSLARGEGTARMNQESIEIYSDIDLNIVTNIPNLFKYNKILGLLSNSFTKYMKKRGLLTHVDISAIRESELKKYTTIRRVECANSDKVVWGKDLLSNLSYSPKSIKKINAIEYLFNRMIDILKIPVIANEYLKTYLITKVLLDLNTSLLAFFGDYTPSYMKRVNLIKTAFYSKFLPDPNFPELIDIFSHFKLKCDFQNLQNQCELIFNMAFNTLGHMNNYLARITATYLVDILKIELIYLYNTDKSRTIDEFVLLKRYLKNNSKCLSSLLLKLNILMIDLPKLNENYKILTLKNHPKFHIHLILYYLLQSKYGSSTLKRRYRQEAYNYMRAIMDISSFHNWSSLVSHFFKFQKTILRRFFN